LEKLENQKPKETRENRKSTGSLQGTNPGSHPQLPQPLLQQLSHTTAVEYGLFIAEGPDSRSERSEWKPNKNSSL
jgi:hypothetical protein